MIKQNSNTILTNIQQRRSKQYDEYFSNNQSEWQYRKISPENLEPFCEQLGNFLKYVRSIQHVTHSTYAGPSNFQSHFETLANELESLYMEVKDAVTNMDRLKKQRKVVRKEISSIKKALKKLHEEEEHLLENEISLYDKSMLARWENIKNTHKPEVLEILINDIEGKQQALEYLNTLISHKFDQLNEPIRVDANSTINQNINIAPKRTYHGSSNPYRSESRRRRRRNQERQENQNGTRTAQFTIQEDSSIIDLPLLHITVGSNPFQTTITGSNSHHELVIVASSTNATQNNDNNNSSSNTNIESEFQCDMRAEIQALFGQLRPTSLTGTTVTISNSERENNNTNQEIELLTIRRAQPPQP